MATTDIQQVHIRLIIERLRPGAEYGWAVMDRDSNGETGNTLSAVWQWRDPRPMPTEAELLAEWDVYQAEQAKITNDDNALRNFILPIAQSAVGIRLDQLSAAQVRALFAITLWKEGALLPDGTVKPLSQWVK